MSSRQFIYLIVLYLCCGWVSTSDNSYNLETNDFQMESYDFHTLSRKYLVENKPLHGIYFYERYLLANNMTEELESFRNELC